MKPETKHALKISAGLVAAYIFLPFLIALINGHHDLGGFFAIKLVSGLALLPFVYAIVWYLEKTQKAKVSDIDSPELTHPKTSKWNYAGIILGPLALFFIFLPDYNAGKTGGTFYIGLLFWIIVIIYSVKNLMQKKEASTAL
ncbi:hypothetical protein C5F52_06355 [Limnohabitans sp. TS-CS-82]|uniref:hypothetical protein n=1 Tax=Limnohabitans sp. TS-CS-82 TaxID=2094193 RepID=UPI000CF28B69|nr:hypothetical protein [Limnohabitans sp. TS-CS-82]PQA84061.1 hypothetical protein C5F52_06355 [Limnohabitans sp. TS-CS-82]